MTSSHALCRDSDRLAALIAAGLSRPASTRGCDKPLVPCFPDPVVRRLRADVKLRRKFLASRASVVELRYLFGSQRIPFSRRAHAHRRAFDVAKSTLAVSVSLTSELSDRDTIQDGLRQYAVAVERINADPPDRWLTGLTGQDDLILHPPVRILDRYNAIRVLTFPRPCGAKAENPVPVCDTHTPKLPHLFFLCQPCMLVLEHFAVHEEPAAHRSPNDPLLLLIEVRTNDN